jgi:hypothetical protein
MVETYKCYRRTEAVWGTGRVENETKIITGKSKTVSFTRYRLKGPLNYSFGDQKFRNQAVLNN